MNARGALLRAFFLGRIGSSVSEIDGLVDQVESDDLMRLDVASLKREVGEVEASRPHKVVAMGTRGQMSRRN
jgi:hypothetical protein